MYSCLSLSIVRYVFDVIDLLLLEFEDSFSFSIVLALLDLSLFVSLHRHRFGVPALDLELTELRDAHLQTGVLSSLRVSFLEPLLRSDATDSGF